MTISIFRDPNDTGDIPVDTAQTARIDIGEATRVIRPEHILHPTTIRRQIDETAVFNYPVTIAVIGGDPSLTGEILALDTGGYPPVPKPTPPQPKHATWTGRVGEFPTVRPQVPRPGRGRHRAPSRHWVAVVAGLLIVGASVGALVVLAVIR